MNRKRLYRCRYDRQIAGVAGGIAEYFDIDPTVVRLIWIVSIFFGGFTILLYILMAFIVPLEPVGYGPVLAGPTGPAGSGAAPGTEGEATGDAAAVAGATDPTAGSASPMHPHGSYWATHGGALGLAPHGGAEDAVPHRHARSGSGAALLTIFGVLLVVFGGIALLGPMVPGWIGGIHLGPAFVLALGIALLAASIRRAAPDR